MPMIGAALADLRFGLSFVSSTYQIYAAEWDFGAESELLFELAKERWQDANRIEDAELAVGVERVAPTLDSQSVGPLLGMGRSEPYSPASVAYRVQRAENSLEHMAAQLQSLAEQSALRQALGHVRRRIRGHREDVRRLRQAARLTGDSAALARPPTAAAEEDGQQVTIWFGTNRERNSDGNFSERRASDVTLGRCRVFVPKNRRMGSLGRGPIGRIVLGDDRVRVLSREPLAEAVFWREIVAETGALDTSERQALIFIHGYCTKFDDAARRTAQLKVDLGHGGPAAFFSWPSLGSKIGYTGDEAAIEGSEIAIENFLADFALRSGAEAVHVIAHSMGNRALLRAVNAIAKAAAAATPVRFGQIFLAAPDVDSEVFANLAAAYSKLSERTTLYVTKNDKAIGLSKHLHRYPRVGLMPPVTILPGIDTIDASRVNLDRPGHSYATEMRAVLADIFDLIQKNTPPDSRFGLRKAGGSAGTHWEFAP